MNIGLKKKIISIAAVVAITATIGSGCVLAKSNDIAGLMSLKSADEVTREHDNLYSAAKVLNITDKIDPFLSLAFLPLPVIPEVRITDSGLFDVINFKFVE